MSDRSAILVCIRDICHMGEWVTVVLFWFVRFEHVPLVTPNGDVLVNELNFEVWRLWLLCH